MNDLNVLLIMIIEIKERKSINIYGNKCNNSSNDYLDLVVYQNEISRDIFSEFTRDYLLHFALSNYYECKDEDLKALLFKIIFSALNENMIKTWINLD